MLAALLMLAVPQPLAAQQDDTPPPGFQGATILDKPDAEVPLDLEFQDEDGQTVRLGDYFRPGHPVLLGMVFFRCSGLCLPMLASEAQTLGRLALVPGRDFEIVTVSFDPTDTPQTAAAKKAEYAAVVAKPEAAGGWHFLTSRGTSARKLGEAIGFGYKLAPDGRSYLHQAGIYVVTPKGRVSRVLQGIHFDPDVLRDSLVYASQGKIGGGLWGVALSCGLLHYDPASGKYTWAAVAAMRLTGILTLLVLGVVIGTLIFSRSHADHRCAMVPGGNALSGRSVSLPPHADQQGKGQPGKAAGAATQDVPTEDRGNEPPKT
jgi:protein SCO1/2